MKKTITLISIISLVIGLTACVQVRNTAPTLVGVQSEVTIQYGDIYDPADGITANDAQDGDLTAAIEFSGYNPAWLEDSRGGIYQYTVYVEDSEGASATEQVQLTVEGSVEQTVSLRYVQTARTYYIGSGNYDPFQGVEAIDSRNDEDLTDNIIVDNLPSLTRTGRYTYTLRVENELGASATISVALTIKNAVDYIPDTLTTDPIEITLWHSNGSTIETALNLYAEEFKTLYPNITVNIQKNGDNYDQLRQNIVSAIKGGTLPNIVQGYPDHVVEYLSNNVILSLNPYIDNPIWGFDADLVDEQFEDILWNYRQENSSYTNDGEFYSLPFNKSTEVMIYNKSVVDDLIASGAITEFPTTWQGLMAISDEFFAVADDYIDDYSATLGLTQDEIDFAKELFAPYSYDSDENAFITLIRQWGGEYTSINSEREGMYEYDTQIALDMLNYFSAHRSELTIASHWRADYASDLFKKGQTFMTIGSTGGAYYNTPSYVNDDIGYLFEFDVAPIPYNADLPESAAAIQQGTNLSLTKVGTDQEKLASWLFLKYLSSKEVQLDFTMKTGYSPIRESVYDTPEYQTFLSGFDQDGVTPLEGEMLMRSKAAAAAIQQSDILFYDPAFSGSSTIRTAVGVAFARVVDPTETDTVESALAYAVSEARRILGLT